MNPIANHWRQTTTGDDVAWNTTIIDYARVTTGEYRISGAHWRQTTTTGNAIRIATYDALLRPITTREYDSANVSGTQRYVSHSYDFANRETFAGYPATAAPSVTGVHTTYDKLGRPTSSSADSELGALTTSMSYPSTSFTTSVTDPRNDTTSTTYQAFDSPSTDAPRVITTAVGFPEQQVTTIARDVFGKPTSVTRSGTYLGSPISEVRAYVYDSGQRLCKTIEPESLATIVNYDAAGNIAWRAAGQNLTSTSACQQANVTAAQKTSYTYDTLDRLTDTTFGDASPLIHTTYTADSLPNTTASDGSTWTYGYNKRRMLTSEALTLGTSPFSIGHTYNANGHESSLTYPDATSVGYAQNALGEASQAGIYATSVQRFPNGGLASFSYGNGITHTTTQTTRGLPDVSTDTNVINDNYDWDPNGNVTAITNGISGGNSSRTMTYDDRDRLTGTYLADFSAQLTFTYDPLDNLRSYVTPFRNWTHEYDSATWHMTRIRDAGNTTQYSYGFSGDPGARGNVTSRIQTGGTTENYTFDLGNRMRSTAGTNAATYTYDGLGRRTRIITAADPRIQVYSQAGQLLYDAPNDVSLGGVGFHPAPVIRCYLYLDRHLVAKITSSGSTITTSYLHTDALGSPVGETSSTGTLLSRTQYEPYGLLLVSPPVQGPGYTGHVYDTATGLNYMQARYRDPVAGRFLSIDPVAASPGSFNRYAYANNNPYKYIDPDGRDCVSASGKTTCTIPVTGSHIPERISFPTPSGVSGTQNSSAASEHQYDIRNSNGGKSDKAVQQSIVNNPTPGSNDRPATPTGTLNYATPSGGRGTLALISSYLSLGSDDPRSPVKSYSATDGNGNTWAINVTEPTHGFHFGYVLRGSVDGQTMSIGEGWAWKQKIPILGSYADSVWKEQNQVNIDAAH